MNTFLWLGNDKETAPHLLASASGAGGSAKHGGLAGAGGSGRIGSSGGWLSPHPKRSCTAPREEGSGPGVRALLTQSQRSSTAPREAAAPVRVSVSLSHRRSIALRVRRVPGRGQVR